MQNGLCKTSKVRGFFMAAALGLICQFCFAFPLVEGGAAGGFPAVAQIGEKPRILIYQITVGTELVGSEGGSFIVTSTISDGFSDVMRRTIEQEINLSGLFTVIRPPPLQGPAVIDDLWKHYRMSPAEPQPKYLVTSQLHRVGRDNNLTIQMTGFDDGIQYCEAVESVDFTGETPNSIESKALIAGTRAVVKEMIARQLIIYNIENEFKKNDIKVKGWNIQKQREYKITARLVGLNVSDDRGYKIGSGTVELMLQNAAGKTLSIYPQTVLPSRIVNIPDFHRLIVTEVIGKKNKNKKMIIESLIENAGI